MNRFDGTLITVEGLDCCGKSSLIDNLRYDYSDFEFTKEPSTGKYGRIVRDELQSDDEPTLSDFFLFLADRFDHCQSLIGPVLDRGGVVLCDRYNLSTMAYQREVVERDVPGSQGTIWINEVVRNWAIEPDLTLYLDVPVDVSMERMGEDREKYERRDRLTKAKRVYDAFEATNDRIKRIDATQSEEEVYEEAVEYIESVV